ncbi:MAG: hypothetical protein J2P17_17965 [Mycobacterium sp.]|nr:hypothetical protein [Mycobacterium sp.]
MSGRMSVGARVTTLVELPVGNSIDELRAPVGTEGVIRRVFDDALGGYQVDLFVADTMMPAIVYGSQMSRFHPVPTNRDRTVR